MQQHFYDTFEKILSSPKKIVITSHTNPDGDAVGSSLALMFFLRKFNHDVNVLIPNEVPSFLEFLPGMENVIIYESNSKLAKQLIEQADFIFSLDYNSIHRSGNLKEILENSKAGKVLIDHHRDAKLADFVCAMSVIDVSSTSELVFDVIDHFGFETYGDKEIAECLFVGIMTDTGSFSYSIYSSKTFEISARLIRAGVDVRKIHQNVYDTFSENRLRLLGFSISERMMVLDDLSTAIIYLSKADLERFDFKVGDTEGVVNYPLSLDKIRLSVLVTEKKDTIRFSFRSKNNFSVHELAQKHFNGGGHVNAAGGNLSCSFEESLIRLKEILLEYKYELNN